MPTSRSVGAVARLAASQHGVVTSSQAAQHGIDRRATRELVRRGFWTEAAPRLFVVTSSPPTWHQRAMLATSALGGAPVLSHASAARLHGVDGFDRDDRVVVTVGRGRRVLVAGVDVHLVGVPMAENDLLVVDGIRCTSLARTLVDVAATDATAVERAIDDFERRGHSLRWLESTAARLHRPGQRGTGLVLREVARRRTRGRVRGSWFQKLIADLLRSLHVPDLEEEYEIRDSHGRFVARVDLAVPVVRVGIEAHSRQFHTGPRAEAHDQERDNRVAEQGWELCYIGYAEATRSPREVRAFVERLVARRAADLGVVLPGK